MGKKKAVEVILDEKVVEVPKSLSEVKKARKVLLEAYKVQNIVKFEHKELDKELKNLK